MQAVLRTTLSALTLPAAPGLLAVRIQERAGLWRIVVRSRKISGPAAGRWARAAFPHAAAVEEDGHVRIDTTTLPSVLLSLARAGGVDLTAGPGDAAVLRVGGEAAAARELVAANGAVLPVLTTRQHGVLESAVAAGYYETPRRTTLRDLGRALDMSPTALGELLRRAEARLVVTYLKIAPPPA